MAFWDTKKTEPEAVASSASMNDAKTDELVSHKNESAKEIISQVVKQQRGKEEEVVEKKQVIVFNLDEEEYAAPILDLKEILRVPPVVMVPGTPPFVKGIFNLRGQIVVVIDLEKCFTLTREHPGLMRDIVIIEVGNTFFGVLVDEVTGILQIPVTSIKSTPDLITTKIHADYLSGVAVLEEVNAEQIAPAGSTLNQEMESKKEDERLKKSRIILLLDLPKMLSDKEFMGFANEMNKTVEEVV